ncbi:AI-2E family transporter [Luteococcus sp. OSA5]|uniref:AI-2E family transporter n=1 Tax=Luteococcus sp. OSA5 TaxID=3401630 RepID=UPI003B431459
MYSAQEPSLQDRMPRGLELALRFGVPALVAVACAWVALWVVGQTRFALVPMAVAMLVTALLTPSVRWLHGRLGLNRYLAGGLCLITLMAAVATLVTLATRTMVRQMGSITRLAQESLSATAEWLRDGPLHVDDAQLQEGVNKGQEWLASNSQGIAQTAMKFSGSVTEVGAMVLLVVVSAFFFLGDGPAIWRSVLWLVPHRSRARQLEASRRSWRSLELYARTAVAVAAIDALGIWLGCVVLGVPFAVPVAMLVFVASFVPFLGAIVSGVIAVGIALFAKGLTTALLMLLVVLLVQQLEGNVLQPLLMGKAVSLHPYAVIIGVSLAGYLWNLPGALLAVPVMAVVMAWLRYLNDDDRFPELGTLSRRDESDDEDKSGDQLVQDDEAGHSPVGARSVSAS